MKQLDLTGTKINNLFVISKEPTLKYRSMFKVKCDCGTIKIVDGPKLNSGRLLSCGCLMGRKLNPTHKEYGEALRNLTIASYKHNAKHKKLEFSLSKDDMIEYFSQNCYYCGRLPYKTLTKKGFYGSFTYNGIDRLDSKLGYIKNNCVACCSQCNYLKNNYNYNDFIDLITKIYKNINRNNNSINFKNE